ncbi:ubiquitin carboxyl-terminal hydrolase 12-like protein [Perkinsela sp. CCAP 1560/4]|nr:ubiquitin carboxyl-terminal hydrolase 12-like protein [Perkinsela sp. CCAP 1560/4]|eukprot:KNH09167.1 ubiquitin carboxyl-terminal hydrolase 12-like protein [Perkinsela sp. CCAP 1560/4]
MQPDSMGTPLNAAPVPRRADAHGEAIENMNCEHLVSIARQLRNLSVDLSHWGIRECSDLDSEKGFDIPSSPFTDCVDDSIFHLASSNEHQAPERTVPWTTPLRYSYRHGPIPRLTLPNAAGNALDSSVFDQVILPPPHIADEIAARERSLQLGKRPPSAEENVGSNYPDFSVPSYEKLLSIITFPIDLQQTAKGLLGLHEKYIAPILSEPFSSENTSMIRVLETERTKLIEKINQLHILSKGTITEELYRVYLENNENNKQTMKKLINPGHKDTKSVMLSMAVHLEVYAACLIDIAHTIVRAEITHRVRMQFFKYIESAEFDGGKSSSEAPNGESGNSMEIQSSLFRDVPPFPDALGHFSSLVTCQEIEALARSVIQVNTEDEFGLTEDAFKALENFIDRIARKLDNEFDDFRDSRGRSFFPADDRNPAVRPSSLDLLRGSSLSKFFDNGSMPDDPTSIDIMENNGLFELREVIQHHPQKFSRAEKAITDYYTWLHREREDAESKAIREQGQWLTYANVHEFLHGRKLDNFPVPEIEKMPEKLHPEAGQASKNLPILPLFLPPTIINTASRVDKEPRSMSSLIENIQISRSNQLQESFAIKILRILNNPNLDAVSLGIAEVAGDAREHVHDTDSDYQAKDGTTALDANVDLWATIKGDRGSYDDVPCIMWPILFLSVPQDRLRKAFEYAWKAKSATTVNDRTSFPNHLQWIYPSPETPSPKHLLQSFFRIGLEKIIQILEKNRLMSDSILLPRRSSDEPPKRSGQGSAGMEGVATKAIESATAGGKPITSVLTHFSSTPLDVAQSQSHAENFYAPPTKQHLLDQLEWNFASILQKSADTYKCLAFGAGAIKGHRVFSRNDLDGGAENDGRRSAGNAQRKEASIPAKPMSPSLENLRELYEQVFVIGMQHCLQQVRPRLLKQLYHDVRKKSDPKNSSREEVSAEKQIQYILCRIFPREESRQMRSPGGKMCQCFSNTRELLYQCIGSWIFVSSNRTTVGSESDEALDEIASGPHTLPHNLENALTGKIRMKLRGLHILRSHAFLSMPAARGRSERGDEPGSLQFPYRFYSPTFFFAGKYWSILAMVNRIKHKNYLSLYLCCVDSVYCHFGFVLLNRRNREEARPDERPFEGDIVHEGHQLFDRNLKENDYGFSNIIELDQLFSPDEGFYCFTTDSCTFDTVITVYAEHTMRTQEKLKVKHSSTYPSGATKDKVANIMDKWIDEQSSPANLQKVLKNISGIGYPDEMQHIKASTEKELLLKGSKAHGVTPEATQKLLRETYAAVQSMTDYENNSMDGSADEMCSVDSRDYADSGYYVGENDSYAYHVQRARQICENYDDQSKRSEAARQKLLEDEEKEKKQEMRKKTVKRSKAERVKLQKDEVSLRDELDEHESSAYAQLCGQFQKKLQLMKKSKKVAKEDTKGFDDSAKAKHASKGRAAAGVPKSTTAVAPKKQPTAVQASLRHGEPSGGMAPEDEEWMCRKAPRQVKKPAKTETPTPMKSDAHNVRPVGSTEKPETRPRSQVANAPSGRQSKPTVASQLPPWAKNRPVDFPVEASRPEGLPKGSTVPAWPAKQKAARANPVGHTPAVVKLPLQQKEKGAGQSTAAAKRETTAASPHARELARPKARLSGATPKKGEDTPPRRPRVSIGAERIGVTYSWREDDDSPMQPTAQISQHGGEARRVATQSASSQKHPERTSRFGETAPMPPTISEDWGNLVRQSPQQTSHSWNAIFGSAEHQGLPHIGLPKFSLGSEKPAESEPASVFSQGIWNGSQIDHNASLPYSNGFSFFSNLKP